MQKTRNLRKIPEKHEKRDEKNPADKKFLAKTIEKPEKL